MAFFPDEILTLTWMVDSGARESVHNNAPGLTQAQSYLGSMVERDGGWGYEVDRVFTFVGSYARAREALVASALARISK
jgi:hypothetical protein